MIRFFIFLVSLSFFSCKKSEMKQETAVNFYVGTYTNGDSEGIYKCAIDKQGVLSKVALVAKTKNPTFLVKSDDKKYLFAIAETNEDGVGFVKSFRIEKDVLKEISKEKSGGAGPCFITTNKNNYVLTANYGGGTIGLLKSDKSGKLSKLLAIQKHFGIGTTDRQKSPHAHSTWFHPTKKEIISVDLGTNELWFSSIDKTENTLVPSKQSKLKMADGAGPRHLVFHPNKKWIYVLNELNNTISLVKEDKKGYYIDSSIKTLPSDFTEFSKAADIHVSKDGKFLYASNRGHESIAIFKVNSKDGSLTTVGYEAVLGKHPRNFSLTPDNKFLLVANRDTNNIVSFKRDNNSGELTYVSEISAPNPVCILF